MPNAKADSVGHVESPVPDPRSPKRMIPTDDEKVAVDEQHGVPNDTRGENLEKSTSGF